jgi:hypothetical protein
MSSARVWFLLALVAACKQTAPYVHVTVSGNATSVTSLAVSATLGSEHMQLPVPKTARALTLPNDFTLELPSGARGDLEISISALDAEQMPVGNGSGSVTIKGNGDYSLAIDLSGANTQDGGNGDASAPIVLHALGSVSPTMGSSIEVMQPSGLQPGDLMLLTVFAGAGASNTITPPVGWTQNAAIVSGTCGGWMTWYYDKVATSSEPTSYAVGFAQNDVLSAAIIAYGNVDTTRPINDSVSGKYDGLPFSTSLITTDANTMLVALIAIDINGPPSWGAPPAGMTQEIAISTIGVFDGLDASKGSTGTKTINGQTMCGTFDLIALSPR